MKTVIIYTSKHHDNTKKVVEAMKEVSDIDLIDVSDKGKVDISKYDLIGFASGIYNKRQSDEILNFIKGSDFNDDQILFIVYTCGSPFGNYEKITKQVFDLRGANYYDTAFKCRGKDTFGFFGRIGGIAKNHPNAKDLKKAQKYILDLISKI